MVAGAQSCTNPKVKYIMVARGMDELTLSCRQCVGVVAGACPSIQVGVHKLAVVLPLAGCVCYTVEGLWKEQRGGEQRGVINLLTPNVPLCNGS